MGLGASRQKWDYLPNAHSDFIFAIIGEELGLLGALFVLVMFVLLFFAGIRIAMRAPDTFGRLLAAGVTAWIGLQTIVNLGAVTGVLPITGVPLPLVSFGGTALVVTLAGIGVLASVARSGAGKETARSGAGKETARSGASRRRRRAPPPSGRRARAPVQGQPTGWTREGPAMNVVIAGGGTAGHVFPAIALADRLAAVR